MEEIKDSFIKSFDDIQKESKNKSWNFLEQKLEKVEEILAEELKCKSLQEIRQHCVHQTYYNRPNIEHYFYDGSLVLEIEEVKDDTGGIQKMVFRIFRNDNA